MAIGAVFARFASRSLRGPFAYFARRRSVARFRKRPEDVVADSILRRRFRSIEVIHEQMRPRAPELRGNPRGIHVDSTGIRVRCPVRDTAAADGLARHAGTGFDIKRGKIESFSLDLLVGSPRAPVAAADRARRSAEVAHVASASRRAARTHERAREETPRVRLLRLRDLLRRAGGDDLAAAVAAFGAEIDDPVGGLDHVEVVLDHDDGVAVVAQAMQHVEQLLDVVEVQAGRRLVEDVERAAGVALGQFARQLHALRLAAGQRRRALAELDVATGPRPSASRACARAPAPARTASAHPRPSCRARRKSCGPCSGSPASRGCSACRGRRRRARTRPAGSASRP